MDFQYITAIPDWQGLKAPVSRQLPSHARRIYPPPFPPLSTVIPA